MPEEWEADRINWQIDAAKGGEKENQTSNNTMQTPNPETATKSVQVVVQGVAMVIPRGMPQQALHCSDIPRIVHVDSDQELGHEGVAMNGVGTE